jgi:hypothetical protein
MSLSLLGLWLETRNPEPATLSCAKPETLVLEPSLRCLLSLFHEFLHEGQEAEVRF